MRRIGIVRQCLPVRKQHQRQCLRFEQLQVTMKDLCLVTGTGDQQGDAVVATGRFRQSQGYAAARQSPPARVWFTGQSGVGKKWTHSQFNVLGGRSRTLAEAGLAGKTEWCFFDQP